MFLEFSVFISAWGLLPEDDLETTWNEPMESLCESLEKSTKRAFNQSNRNQSQIRSKKSIAFENEVPAWRTSSVWNQWFIRGLLIFWNESIINNVWFEIIIDVLKLLTSFATCVHSLVERDKLFSRSWNQLFHISPENHAICETSFNFFWEELRIILCK